MRVVRETTNIFYIEGIVDSGFFWVDIKTLRVNEGMTVALLSGLEGNSMSVSKANAALWQWAKDGYPNKDF